MSAFSSTALGPDSLLFRGRQAELARLTQICQGDVTAYTVIYGGHQNGKTSLLLQLEARLREINIHVCTITFQGIPGATPPEAYVHIGQQIATVLPMGVSATHRGDAPGLTEFLTQALQRGDVKRFVVMLDELGALPTTTRVAVGYALRALFHDRLKIPALAKLQIIFSGGIELYDLVVTEASSLHNICEEIYLEDLREGEAVGLIADGLRAAGIVPDDAADIGQLVYAQVSGHPYLTQRIGGLLAADAWRGVAIGPEEVEHAVRQISEGGNPLLRQIQNDLHEHHLEDAARRLLTTPPRYTRLNEDMLRLELIGLARRDGDRWAPRNPLLADVFREVLEVPAPMPEPTSAIPQAHGESDSAPPVSDVQSVVTAKKRRLAALELQAARYGIDCPPHISVEIDELRQEIAQFAPRTATVRPVRPVAPAATPVTPTVTQPPPTSVASVTPSSPAPAPAPAAVGMWAKRYGWVVIPFLLIIAVIAIPQTRSALFGSVSQPTVATTALRTPTSAIARAATVAPTVAPIAAPTTAPPIAPTDAPTSAPTLEPTPLPAWVPALVKIAAGSFLMGSTDADLMASSDEKPQHSLELPDYWIGKTEVTNAQFRQFVKGDGYTNKDYWTQAGWDWRTQNSIVKPGYWDDSQWNGDMQPVVGVSWFEAVAYCHWLSAQTGHEFRLPSEAEWEKAARGSDGRIWPWGNTWEANRANSKEAGVGKTTPVGQYPDGASPYGALDMAGNVWEWVATKYGKSYPYQLEDEWQSAYLEADVTRVFRGGSYYHEQTYVRGASRVINYYARSRVYHRGLRVASRSPLPGSGS